MMDEVVVEYDYTGKESDELTIKKGDIIKNVVKKPGGWWEGFLKDKRGMFPDNFVRSLDQDSSVILRNKKDVSRIRQCRVVFSYSQDHEDELNLNVGDVINIVGEEEEGWWRGILNGKEGVFPSNFVEEIVPQSCPKPTDREDITSAAEVRVPKLPSKPSKQFCEVKFPYKAQNDDELTLKEGEVITLISKDSQDPGWWKGELNGHIGVFPDNFVTLISSYDDRGSHKDENKSSNIDTGAIKSSSIALQRKSLEIRNEKVNGDPNVSTSKIPPVPGKKPLIPIKKSSSGSGVGIFSEIKKKLVDVVDGATGSKSAKPEEEIKTSGNAFDQVERRSLLTDIRATRAKPPGRRLPTVMHKDADITVFNGNAEHLIQPNVQSNNIPESENFEKRRVREWEKHKSPWLEEMKLNQAKRTSTSPGPESKLKLTPTTDSNTGLEDTNLDKFVGKQIDLSKLVPPMDLSKSLSSVDNMQNIINDEENPILPSAVLNRQSLPLNLKDIIKDSSAVKAPTGSSTSPVTSKDAVFKKPVIEKSIERELNIENHDISYMQYRELFERLQKLEVMFENQNKVIEDLKNKLQIETDMRMMLQEKEVHVAG